MPRLTCGDAGGVNDRGQPCGTLSGLQEDGRCFRHSAHTADRIEDARRRVKRGQQAGQLRRKPIREDELPPELKTYEDAKAWLAFVARQTAIGRRRDKDAQAITRAVAEWVKAESGAGTAARAAEIEAELRKVKAQLGRQRAVKVVR